MTKTIEDRLNTLEGSEAVGTVQAILGRVVAALGPVYPEQATDLATLTGAVTAPTPTQPGETPVTVTTTAAAVPK